METENIVLKRNLAELKATHDESEDLLCDTMKLTNQLYNLAKHDNNASKSISEQYEVSSNVKQCN